MYSKAIIYVHHMARSFRYENFMRRRGISLVLLTLFIVLAIILYYQQ